MSVPGYLFGVSNTAGAKVAMPPRQPRIAMLVALDAAAKGLLVASLVVVVIDPTWGNLEGKAPVQRALLYPLLAFILAIAWWLLKPSKPFPWLADFLLTLLGFSDILGNRLNLYDTIWWFDDAIHFVNCGMVAAAVLLLSDTASQSPVRILERAVALPLTGALAWEVWEYLSFVTRSPERFTAYGDTMGDLVLGWAGAMTAGLMMIAARRNRRQASDDRRRGRDPGSAAYRVTARSSRSVDQPRS